VAADCPNQIADVGRDRGPADDGATSETWYRHRPVDGRQVHVTALLSGFRISEGQRLERAWVSAKGGYVGFPDTKGDAQVRAIGPSAVKVITEQPVRLNSPYVFPSEVSDGYFTAAKACLERLCVSVGLGGVTPHTLRHTFASVAGDVGFSELTIRAMLGHGSQSVTQYYIHIDEALKLAAARTSDEIASLLDGAKRTKDAGASRQAA
jgi:integrase